MIDIGGVTLSPNLIWSDRWVSAKVRQVHRETLGGTDIIGSGTVESFPITLVATSETGWLTLAQVDAVILLAESAGQQYTLNIHGDSYLVHFRNDEPPAVQANPLSFRWDDESPENYFTATIKLRALRKL